MTDQPGSVEVSERDRETFLDALKVSKNEHNRKLVESCIASAVHQFWYSEDGPDLCAVIAHMSGWKPLCAGEVMEASYGSRTYEIRRIS